MYSIENARTYVFLHDFMYEIHENRTGWQSCSISQRRDSLKRVPGYPSSNECRVPG